MRGGLIRRLTIAVAALAIAGGGFLAWQAHQGFQRAEQYSRFGLWPDARQSLQWYLRLHPSDDAAHLALAEAFIKDEALPRVDAVVGAAAQLAAVPDSSRFAAMARSQEGRMELLLLNRPERAEQRFRRAIEVNSAAIDPYFMIWKLYDLTGRSHLAEAEFWKVYEASHPRERGQRLNEWYMSQFYPATANPALDQLMGIGAPAQDAARTEAQRFIRFRDAEPDGSFGHAALARWFEQEGDPKFALQVLEKGAELAPSTARDPMFLSTMINVLIATGDIDRAEKVMQSWPEPHAGYEYWLSLGQVRQEVDGDAAGAIDAYDQALVAWPGPVDWRTLNRKAACLTQLRRSDEAAALREQIKVVEELTNDKLHQSLRQALGSLEDPDKLQPVIDFYRRLKRPLEATGWEEYAAFLKTRAASDRPSQ